MPTANLTVKIADLEPVTEALALLPRFAARVEELSRSLHMRESHSLVEDFAGCRHLQCARDRELIAELTRSPLFLHVPEEPLPPDPAADEQFAEDLKRAASKPIRLRLD